eukprot:TRINITY_DN27066_c0_g3_i1.p1 TRINITY_DN27066_c0_g3~~TRINITY_DN27066_c0_g3_i1.p1  ORF type:complete len:390 (-),score=57.08 TRINITY_DN27066_c0_g3_i1:287-1456(-)
MEVLQISDDKPSRELITPPRQQWGLRNVNNLPEGSLVDYVLKRQGIFELIIGALSVGCLLTIWVTSPLLPFLALASGVMAVKEAGTPIGEMSLKLCASFLGLTILPHILKPIRSCLNLKPRINAKDAPFNQRLVAWWTRCGRSWFGEGSAVVYESEVAAQSVAAHGREQTPPSIVMCHPHGMYCLGNIFFISWESKMAHSYVMVANSLLVWAGGLIRSYMDNTAPLLSNAKKCVKAAMSTRRDIYVVPGGFESATLTVPGEDRDYFMSNRFGLVKYALQGGYQLVPSYTFGESSLYANPQCFIKLRLWLNKFGIPAIVPFGWLGFPLLPRREPMVLVYGNPVVFPHIESPTEADVRKYHAIYADALRALYTKYAPYYYNDGCLRTLTLL